MILFLFFKNHSRDSGGFFFEAMLHGVEHCKLELAQHVTWAVIGHIYRVYDN